MNPIRILIVEDDADIGDLLQATLTPPYECLRGANGMEGFQMALEGQPDLIISDIMMPVMDGYEMINRLRKDPTFSQTPVILLSALGGREQIRKGYDLGATLYLTKPIDPARLKRNIELFIEDHDVQAEVKQRTVADIQLNLGSASDSSLPKAKSRKRPRPIRPASPAEPSAPPPRSPVDVKSRPAPTPESQERDEDDKPEIRILLVEDEHDTSEMVKAGLEKEYEIISATDGIEAIERAVRYRPDIFIIDGMLPKMTGYQLVAMLKKNKTFQDTPVIFTSGKASARDKQYVKRLGIKYFLGKPFGIDDLKKILDEVTAQPSFTITYDRISHRKASLENLRDFETHRA